MYRAYLSTMASKGAASKLKLIIFLGSTRENRLGDRVGKFVTSALKAEGKYDIEVLGEFKGFFFIILFST